ncbi:hypothetical protein [Roseibium sp.]|uniref:hypothetical protein n=1 Tax=Roseibium sp. TaxID=1936156 RepID=UPI003B5087C4
MPYSIVVILMLFLGMQSAEAMDCPGSVAAISDTELNAAVIPKTRAIYQHLGSELKLVKLPGRRGILAFNSGRVDGELFRITIVEKLYQAAFVRSQYPLLQTQQGVWVAPAHFLGNGDLIGYVIGRRWQEEFAENNSGQYRFVEYSRASDMRHDYNAGHLDGFLGATLTIDELMKGEKLSERPVLALKIILVKVYHYLDERYAHFMSEFDRLLQSCSEECQYSQVCKHDVCNYN